MKTAVLTIALISLILGGCASTETVKAEKGQGVTRTYPFPYGRVYDAVLSAAKTKELEVVESHKAQGNVVLSHGVTLWSWGERIAVFVKGLAANATEVEIVSKPVLAPLNFPPDWQQILFDQISKELRGNK